MILGLLLLLFCCCVMMRRMRQHAPVHGHHGDMDDVRGREHAHDPLHEIRVLQLGESIKGK